VSSDNVQYRQTTKTMDVAQEFFFRSSLSEFYRLLSFAEALGWGLNCGHLCFWR